MLTLDKDPLSLAVSPLFWEKKKKAEPAWMPFRSRGKSWDIGEILSVVSYLGLLRICKLCSSLEVWRVICSWSEMYRPEYTFGRVKLWVNSCNKGEVWLIAEDVSVGIATRNILCLKNTDVRVLELAQKEQSLINSSLILLPWLVRVRALIWRLFWMPWAGRK